MEAVQWKGHKLIKRADGHTFLFDLESDPAEEQNLADQRPEEVELLSGFLDRARENAVGTTEPVVFPRQTEADLRALGYIE